MILNQSCHEPQASNIVSMVYLRIKKEGGVRKNMPETVMKSNSNEEYHYQD